MTVPGPVIILRSENVHEHEIKEEYMAVTIKDIARIANVSRGTVDRVLNNRGGVKREVELCVKKIAADLGYKPNRAGKVLAARKKPIRIGCLLPSVDNPFFDDVIAGLRAAEKEVADYGVTVELTAVKGYDIDTHLEAIEGLRKKNIDALCLTTVDVPAMIDKINELVAAGVPVATINSDVRKTNRLFYIGCDYFKSGRTAAGMMANLLKEKGRTLIVTGSLKMQGHNSRIHGFCRECKESKLDISIVDVVESQDDNETAYQMTKESLCRYPGINSVYITAAGVSGVCRAVRENGPASKISIVCFDDIPETRRAVLEGTIGATICQEPFKQGYQAIQQMFHFFLESAAPNGGMIYTGNIIKIKQNIEA